MRAAFSIALALACNACIVSQSSVGPEGALRDSSGSTSGTQGGGQSSIGESTTGSSNATSGGTTGGSTGSTTGTTGTAGDAPVPRATTHEEITISANTINTTPVQDYRWFDADGRERVLSLVSQSSGAAGYMRRLRYHLANGDERVVTGTNSNGWNGWGYVVMHYASTADTSISRSGTVTQPLNGKHHARFQFVVPMYAPSSVQATVSWMVATGRDHPLYSITFEVPSGTTNLQADTRSPYGDVSFDGIANNSGTVGGLEWGDAYRFTTTGAEPATMFSAWDYSTPNTIPYVRMWSSSVDAEQGAVSTERFADGLAAGDYAGGSVASLCHGRTSLTKLTGCGGEDYDGGNDGPFEVMPQAWLWPYQLSQWELHTYGQTSSKRMAWGTNYGAVGQSSVSSFGRSKSGFPFLSYAVRAVFGVKSNSSVRAEVADLERLYATALTVSEGGLRQQSVGGVGRTDLVTLAKPGYNPNFDTFEIDAEQGRASWTITTPESGLQQPMFRVFGRDSLPTTLTYDGHTLTADRDYFATLEGDTVWLTLNFTVSGAHAIVLR